MAMVDKCCAPQDANESHQWALTHFGGAPLGDARRTRRLVQVATAMVAQPGGSLPQQMPDWADLMGAYRLLSHEQIDPQDMLRPHLTLTRQQAQTHPVVLCVQDDSQLNFTLRTGISGLGLIGDGSGQGLVQHGALAVLPDKQLLGVLDLYWYAAQKAPKGETKRQRQSRWTTRDVWHETAQRLGRWAAGSHLIHVGDRHADLFRLMHEARGLGHGFVLRAMHDRALEGSADHLWAKLTSQPVLGTHRVHLGEQRDEGNRLKRAARDAELTLRAAPIRVAAPAKDPRTAGAPPLDLWAVYLLEEHPPEGAEPVEWMLLTNLETQTLAQALTIIGYYTCRWVIEEWHRCLKEGCRFEASQLDEAQDLQRLGAVLTVVAVRLLQMRDLANASSPEADSPAALQQRMPALHITVVAALAGVDPGTLTPRLFWRTIAKQGGYLGRKHDPRPGWKVLWRGWANLAQMVRGAELYQQLPLRRKISV